MSSLKENGKEHSLVRSNSDAMWINFPSLIIRHRFLMETMYDKKIDAIYISFTDMPYAYGKDLDEERRVDYDINGDVRGVELQCISKGVVLYGLPKADEIAEILKGIKWKK